MLNSLFGKLEDGWTSPTQTWTYYMTITHEKDYIINIYTITPSANFHKHLYHTIDIVNSLD